jgi:probable DNA repair protein
LLELSDDILAHLKHGGTLIVPTRQRAAAVRLAHTASQLAAGQRSWNSPDVLSWSSWLERALDAGRIRQAGAPRRLAASEEWLCWREALQAAGAQSAVLFADALVDSVRRAVTLLDDYALPLLEAVSAESMLLLGARRLFRERCAQLGAIGTTSWQDCARFVAPASGTRLAGFTALGPARRRWLLQLGVDIDEPAARAAAGVPVHACADLEGEAAAAADWCAGVLARDPQARLLLVVPRLAEQPHRWQRALSERLEYRAILSGDAAVEPAAFALEGGGPLRRFPLLASALDLIALSAGKADFHTLSALLRSPYLGALDTGARLTVDLWLREHNVDTAEVSLLRGLMPALERAAGAAAAAALAALLTPLAPGEPGHAGSASPAQWAALYVQRLAACGWPGAGLASPEQQVRARFDELLNEFAALASEPRAYSAGEACALLDQLAARSPFEPASDDVPVTLTASLDDPIVRYDGVWIAGLTADAWPAPAEPDPLIPMALQLAAGVPGATAAGQRQRALAALGNWGRAARSCQWSWARSDGDLDCAPSRLLAECAASEVPTAAEPTLFLLEAALASGAPVLEAWSDANAPPWSRAGALRGGTRLLELQSNCPFRSFAQLRLQAQPLVQPVPGIDARTRGRILHRALELFWQAVRDSTALAERGEQGARVLAHHCVARALQETESALPGLLPPRLLAAEGARAEQLLGLVREWERTREPFAVAALECKVPLELAGATLQLRLDRVDALADGARLVIDYKSGAADPFESAASRPAQPQLPAYALASGTGTCGVLALQLAPEGLKLRGAADRDGRIPGLARSASGQPEWSWLQQHWWRELNALLREFLDGDARVAPQPGACEHCHLEVFCRIEHPRVGGST